MPRYQMEAANGYLSQVKYIIQKSTIFPLHNMEKILLNIDLLFVLYPQKDIFLDKVNIFIEQIIVRLYKHIGIYFSMAKLFQTMTRVQCLKDNKNYK